MFDNTPDAFSYASCNGKKIADIEQELNTYLLANPINKLLKLVKEILGHSKKETTMRYAHAVPKRKMDAINVLNSYS